MEKRGSAVVLTWVMIGATLLAGNIMTWTWPYHDDGRCDVCGGRAQYHVISFISGTETHEFCFDHAFLWSFVNPWIPADIPLSLHLVSLFVLFLIVFGFSFLGFSVRERILRSKRQRISKVTATLVFILGSIVFIGGIALAVTHPERPLVWEPKSEFLASEEIMEVPAKWKSKNETLVEDFSTSPKYESNEELIDEVISVWGSRTYRYSSYFFSPGSDVKNFTMFGDATEESLPQTPFNFYIFDGRNFGLWEAGENYTAYYEAKDKTSLSFDFSIPDPFPQEEIFVWFYFVVEECVPDMKPTVSVIATTSWSEKNFTFEYIDYHEFYLPYSKEIRDIIVEGTATEIRGNRFNFYIMDGPNFYAFENDEAYTAFYESRNTPALEFSLPLTLAEDSPSICFIVENPNLDIDEVVSFSASISWAEEWTTGYNCYEHGHEFSYFFWELDINETKDFALKGSATETSGMKFNFYLLNYTDYVNWQCSEAYDAYHQEKNVTTTTFSIPLSKEETSLEFCFVAENHLIDKNETVKLSAMIEWKELTTTFGGWMLGALVSFVGSMVATSAGPAAALMLSGPEHSNKTHQKSHTENKEHLEPL